MPGLESQTVLFRLHRDNWHFFKHWEATVYGKYTAFDFENGSKGDADWYLYDVDEYGAGLSVLVTW